MSRRGAYASPVSVHEVPWRTQFLRIDLPRLVTACIVLALPAWIRTVFSTAPLASRTQDVPCPLADPGEDQVSGQRGVERPHASKVLAPDTTTWTRRLRAPRTAASLFVSPCTDRPDSTPIERT